MNMIHRYVDCDKQKNHLATAMLLWLQTKSIGDPKLVSFEYIANEMGADPLLIAENVIDLLKGGFLVLIERGSAQILCIAERQMFDKVRKAARKKAFVDKEINLTKVAICDISTENLRIQYKEKKPYLNLYNSYKMNCINASPEVDAFLFFWSLYPKKEKKKESVLRFNKLPKNHKKAILKRMFEMYEKELWPEKIKFCKKPNEWLEEEMWLAELPEKDISWMDRRELPDE